MESNDNNITFWTSFMSPPYVIGSRWIQLRKIRQQIQQTNMDATPQHNRNNTTK